MKIRFNNGVVEVYIDGILVDKARINFVTASYSEDRPDLIGIVRMTELDIEYDNNNNTDFAYESEAWTKAWNDLCVLEYNTMDDDDDCYPYYDGEEEEAKKELLTWRDEAKSDIAKYPGVDTGSIDIEE